MDMRVDAAGSKNLSLPRQNFRRSADLHPSSYSVHDAGITGLSYRSNPTVSDCNISLIYSGVIENQRVGNHQIRGTSGTGCFGRLPHTIADDLAAAELHLIAVDCPVRFDFDDELGIP